MGSLEPKYYRAPLEALGLELPATRVPDGRLYFPIATVCAAIEMEVRPQRARVRRDYSEYLERLRLATAGGPQELLCIEYEALGLWLASIQERSTNERTQERLRLFRRAVMAMASKILQGKMQPVALDERRTLPGSAEMRLAELERAVFVGDEADDRAGGEMISVSCPHCGGEILIEARSIVSVRGG